MTGGKDLRSLLGQDEDTGLADVAVSTHRSSPDRIVFVESGNPDGWISTDTPQDLPR